ncbi:MAG: ABC transporter permease [Thaumarchaeota archaeon]|nr:ABC transporter permease [Nitrososphaerota archaeon]
MSSSRPRRWISSLWYYLRALLGTTPGRIGIGLSLGFILVAVLAPWIAPYSPTSLSGQPYLPPSMKHILGTDDAGEDLLSQLIWGARGSLLVGLSAAAISVFLGVSVGLLAGFYGGRRGETLMRVTDVILVLPLLPLLIVVAALVPGSVLVEIVVIGILSWPPTARVIRSQTLTLKARPFVDASRLSGMSDSEIMTQVLLPNMIPLAVLYGVFSAVSAVVIESGLDFIGLGSINNLSWGIMLYFALARNALLRGSWWWFLPPGLMIALLGTGLILVGYSLEKVAKIR